MWTSPDLKNIKMAGIKLSTQPINAKRPIAAKTIKVVKSTKNPIGLYVRTSLG